MPKAALSHPSPSAAGIMRCRRCIIILAAAMVAPTTMANGTTIGGIPTAIPIQGCFHGGLGPLADCTFSQATLDAAVTSPGGLTAPFDGIVLSWTLRADVQGTTSAAVRLRILSGDRFVASGSQHALPEGLDEYTFDTRLPIAQGDRIGVGVTVEADNAILGGAVYVSAVAPVGTEDVWGPSPADGTTTAPSAEVADRNLMLQAEIEPDADGDGFGDETEDECPTDASTQGVCPPPPDLTAPSIVDPSLSNGRFRVDRRGSVAGLVAPAGTLLRFDLSEDAQVTASIERASKGRLVDGECRPTRKRVARKRRCTLYAPFGSFSFAAGAGRVEKPFSGRLAAGDLIKGPYRMTLTGTDAAGNTSAPVAVDFRVVR